MLDIATHSNFYIIFNLIESLLWFAFAIGFWLARNRQEMIGIYWITVASLFLLFGISDIIEAYIYPINFFDPPGYWLLIWKGLCVVGFVVCLVWYLKKRLVDK